MKKKVEKIELIGKPAEKFVKCIMPSMIKCIKKRKAEAKTNKEDSK
ncbi:hypothetical protein [Bacillus thuringiensis]|nr:hypothetical protein [Bacillus thuringiensis]MDO6630491.1 hypothetical protein [Bacillus thuringiensis]MDO6660684.1 hypothetical protein [Bacillus thuringiensis]MDO6700615.1 hypothetical protein [Bacillus thuringiensis]